MDLVIASLCYIIEDHSAIGFSIVRLGLESQPCHSLAIWLWFELTSPGMMKIIWIICKNAFLKDH